MTSARIICSRRPERVWQTRPQWQHPSRREHIHNKVQGLPDRRDPRWLRLFYWLTMAVCAGYALYVVVPS